MPGHARKDIVRKGEIGIYHTWSRCVQQAFLCGIDPVTGVDYEHRRGWIASLLQYQASVFAVDVANYSILSNHQHLIVRLRPDIANSWNDEEVAWRWKLAWPDWVEGKWSRQPTDEEIQKLLNDPSKIAKMRENLADLSWFMARWKEPIAKMANAESGTKGHYYDQRFGSRELVDDGGLICCNVYVDLNQGRAGIAHSLDECRYSAIYDRIHSWRQREVAASLLDFRDESAEEYRLESADLETLFADCFLAPIGENGPLILVDGSGKAPARTTTITADAMDTPEASRYENINTHVASFNADLDSASVDSITSVDSKDSPSTSLDGGIIGAKTKKPTWAIHGRLQQHRRPRASDHVILDMQPQQYLKIVELSAAQIWSDKPRPPPDELSTLLDRYGIQPSCWQSALEHFETWFHHLVGSPGTLATKILNTGQKWVHGAKACRKVFR